MTEVNREDFAEARQQGDMAALAMLAAGLTLKSPKKKAAAGPETRKPGYHIPRKGAWPCGTAASGPTPAPCTDCQEGTTHAHPTH